jgi:hypothetical protein
MRTFGPPAYGKARDIWAGATRPTPAQREARDGERRSASDFPATRSPKSELGLPEV